MPLGRAIIKSLSDLQSVRAHSKDPTVHAMFDKLLSHAERHGWTMVFTKSKTAGVQFHKEHSKGSYRHSFIVNANALNFYLRPPALRIDHLASRRAEEAFEHVKPAANRAGETTVQLRSVADAQRAAEMFLI